MANLQEQSIANTNSLLGRGQDLGYGPSTSVYGPPPFIYNPAISAARQSQQLAAAEQKAFNEAKAANEKRYSDILGADSQSPLLAAIQANDPTVMKAIQSGARSVVYKGKQYTLPNTPFRQTRVDGKVQSQLMIGGQWVDASTVTPQQRVAAVSQSLRNPNAPLMGGYYGIYDRAQNSVANQTTQQNALNKAYGDRTNTAMGFVANSGKQERIDINERYNALQSSEHSNLVNRGLTASTVATSVANQVERERTKALGGLNDRQAMLNVNTYAPLSGQALEAQGQGNRYLGGLDYQNQTALPEQMLNYAERRNDLAPSLAQYNQIQSGLGSLSAAGLYSASLGAQQRSGQPAGRYGLYG